MAAPSPAARAHARLAEARERIVRDDAATVRTQVAVSEIAAPTGAEARRGRWLARRLRAAGFANVRTDDAGNVVAARAGATALPPIVVCAHMDTVFPADTPLAVRSEGGRLVGPGIGDNGRGLAALLALAPIVAGDPPRRRAIHLACTVGEEGLGDLRGVKHLLRAGEPRPAAVIALDGPGDERVVHRALGSRRFRIAFNGPGGHSWAAFGVANAVHAAAATAARLATLALPRTPRTTLTVGRIGGGISVNAIPVDGWLEVDLRSTSADAVERFDAEIRLAARAAEREENARRARGSAPLACTITVIGDRPCGEVPDDDPLVVAALDATRLVGREPELSTASTDANVPIALGIPAVAIGAGGRGGEAHTPAEWYDNADGPLGIVRALTLIAAAADAP